MAADDGAGSASTLLALQGKAAIANAQARVRALPAAVLAARAGTRSRRKGARVQRPLWASTSTKNPAYRDVIYVEQLIGPHTVNTMPPATIDAFRDHGVVARTVDADVDGGATAPRRRSRRPAFDSTHVTDKLLPKGSPSFQKSFDTLSPASSRKSGVARSPADDDHPVCSAATPIAVHRRTKIVCTLGPSSTSTARRSRADGRRAERRPPQLLARHARAARASRSRLVRDSRARSADRPVAILGDLQGPRIRIGDLAGPGHASRRASDVVLVADEGRASGATCPTTYAGLARRRAGRRPHPRRRRPDRARGARRRRARA